MMKGKIIFEEEQSFVGTWMWFLVIGISLLSIAGTITSYFLVEDPEGFIGLLIASLVTICIVALFYTSKLYVSMDKEAIYFRYPPFVNSEKVIRKNDLQELTIRKYRAIREYGGWGYRHRFRSGRALTTSGNVGMQIVAKNGNRILIGTQKPELLERAIRQLKEN
jgi:hypothetical protein